MMSGYRTVGSARGAGGGGLIGEINAAGDLGPDFSSEIGLATTFFAYGDA